MINRILLLRVLCSWPFRFVLELLDVYVNPQFSRLGPKPKQREWAATSRPRHAMSRTSGLGPRDRQGAHGGGGGQEAQKLGECREALNPTS